MSVSPWMSDPLIGPFLKDADNALASIDEQLQTLGVVTTDKMAKMSTLAAGGTVVIQGGDMEIATTPYTITN